MQPEASRVGVHHLAGRICTHGLPYASDCTATAEPVLRPSMRYARKRTGRRAAATISDASAWSAACAVSSSATR